MSGRATVDRMVPSVEDVAADYRDSWEEYLNYAAMHRNNDEPLCPWCDFLAAIPEAVSVGLDMALAQESDARRAEAARIRAGVAWA